MTRFVLGLLVGGLRGVLLGPTPPYDPVGTVAGVSRVLLGVLGAEVFDPEGRILLLCMVSTQLPSVCKVFL